MQNHSVAKGVAKFTVWTTNDQHGENREKKTTNTTEINTQMIFSKQASF